MPRRALVDHRPWLLAGVFAAVAYYFLQDTIKVEPIEIAIKGLGVGFLAIYAMRRAPGADGMILTAALALSALADMALELWFEAGGALFAASHLVAIGLYMRNRRDGPSLSQQVLGVLLFVMTPSITYVMTGDLMVTIYAMFLGAMAAAAWTSRFPRYRVGMGAILFVVSDWLIFSRMGTFDLGDLPDLLVWPLYFAGQLMIATGVVQTLRGETPAR